MFYNPKDGTVPGDDWKENQRRTGRMQIESVACDLGPVLDLSSTGMRVECSRLPKGDFEIVLMGLDTKVKVMARPVWSRRIGLFKRVIGLRFVDVTPETAKTLTKLAMINCHRRAC